MSTPRQFSPDIKAKVALEALRGDKTIQEMQTDLDAYLVTYNTKRPHQGRGMNGRTPADVFARCLPKTNKPKEDKVEKAA